MTNVPVIVLSVVVGILAIIIVWLMCRHERYRNRITPQESLAVRNNNRMGGGPGLLGVSPPSADGLHVKEEVRKTDEAWARLSADRRARR